MDQQPVCFELSNGVRVVHHPFKGGIIHCALMINAGTRDEEKENMGLAHLIEHCIFKGTKSKSGLDILNSIDAVGGELNAYTTKEETCVYASCSLAYIERAMELLADICLNSIFPAKEMQKEKDVVSDEIHSYLDSPAEQIYDDFEGMVFHGHPLGRNILGSEKKMRSLKRADLIAFIQKHYRGRNIVFSCSGDLSESRLKALARKHFGQFRSGEMTENRKAFQGYRVQNQHLLKKTHQAHCIIGNQAYDSKHKHRTALILLNNILGGPAMNSRLNLGIREKYGYTYQLDSSYTAYSDSGLFSIYFGTDAAQLNKTTTLILRELKLLRTKKLGAKELFQAKEQLCGQVALARESRLNIVFSNARHLLLFGKAEPIQPWLKQIRTVSASHLLEVANEIFEEKQLSNMVFSGRSKK
jgi:predicted Zn-dependent peptidase